jgi:hypothetical protein
MRHKFAGIVLLLVAFTSIPVLSLSKVSFSKSNAAQDQERVSVPAGTRILVRTVDAIDSSKQRAGQRFTGNLETDLRADNVVVAPRGTTVHGRLVDAQSAGRMAGGAQLTLELTDIVINGAANPVVTSTYERRSSGQGGQTAAAVGGGVGLGALIGGIAGGGRGAGIGAAVGGAGGTAASAASGGEQVSIPSESLLEFRLEQPLSLPGAR